MSLITLIVLVVAVWLIYTYVLPSFPEPIRTIAVVVLGIALLWYVLRLLGLL